MLRTGLVLLLVFRVVKTQAGGKVDLYYTVSHHRMMNTQKDSKIYYLYIKKCMCTILDLAKKIDSDVLTGFARLPITKKNTLSVQLL